jgi:hypothetical protein
MSATPASPDPSADPIADRRAPSAVPPGFTGPRSVDLDALRMPPLWMIVVACVFILGALLAPERVPRMGRLSMAAIGLSFLVNFVPSRVTVIAIMAIALGTMLWWMPEAGAMMLIALAGYAASRAVLVAARRRRWEPVAVAAIYAAIWAAAILLLASVWRFMIEVDVQGDVEAVGDALGSIARLGIAGAMAGFVGGLLTSTVGGVVVRRPSLAELDAMRDARSGGASEGRSVDISRPADGAKAG